jgi:hypothetical protein
MQSHCLVNFPFQLLRLLQLLQLLNPLLNRMLTYSRDLTFAMGGSISGLDLLTLASGCPNLETVNLPASSELMACEPCPRGECIDDITIDKFARALSKIETFSFGLENCSILTHQAVISLARHCPELSNFNITANISIPDLIQGLEQVSKEISAAPLPSVTFIKLYLAEDIPHTYDNIASLADRFVRLAPEFCELVIRDGSEDDDEFQLQVESLARPWMHNVDPQD